MAKLSVLFILIFVMTSARISRATGVSCNFKSGRCGWSNDNNVDLSWSRKRCLWCNKYMKLAMADAKVDDTGRLSSPWLNGSVHHSCQLRFRYYIKNCYTCQLSVFLRTDTNFTSLWKTTDATYWFQDSPNINVPCTRRRYQLVFEGKKVRQSSWNPWDDEIDIDDVEFEQSFISSPPTTSTAPFTTTTEQQQSTQHQATDVPSPNRQTVSQTATSLSSPVHSDNPATTVGTMLSSTPSGGHPAALSNTDNDTGLATGALVAITVTVIVAGVVVVIVVFFLLRRRKETGQKTDCRMPWFFKRNLTSKPASTDKTTVSRAVDNCGYSPDDEHTPAHDNAVGTATSTKGRHPGSVHLYSTPDDSGYELASLPHTHGTPRQVSTRQDSNNLSSPRDVKPVSSQRDVKPVSSPRDVKPVSSAPLPGHSYENVTTQHGSEPDEYAVPHADRKSEPPGAAEGEPVYETTAEENSQAPAPVYSAQGRLHGENYYSLLHDQGNEYSLTQGENNEYSLGRGGSSEYSLAQGEDNEYSLGQDEDNEYSLAQGEDSEYSLGQGEDNEYSLGQGEDNEYSLAQGEDNEYSLGQGEDNEYALGQGEDNEDSLGQEGQDKYGLAHNVAAPASAEAAAIYAMAGTTNYEIVDDDGGRLATSSSAPSGDVYNRLNAKGGPAVGQEVHQNHYDHFNGPACTGAEYSSLGLEERTRDLQREMAEGDYSHI